MAKEKEKVSNKEKVSTKEKLPTVEIKKEQKQKTSKHPPMNFIVIHYSDTKRKFVTRSASPKTEITVKNDPLNTRAWARIGEKQVTEDNSKKSRFSNSKFFS